MALRHFLTWQLSLCVFLLSMCSTSRARQGNNSKTTTKIARNITWNHKGMFTHYGKNFVLALITPSRSPEEDGRSEIFIRALENDTDVRVRIPCSSFDKKYSLMKEQVVRIEIPTEAQMTRDAKIETKGAEISASKDIVVYALNNVNASSQGDRFLVYPRRALGIEYVATSYAGSHSNLGIVGVYNNTNVSIVLNQHARVTYKRRVYKRGDTLRFPLNELQTFYVRSRHDLSGVRVITDKPVAVFSGASCVFSKRAPNCGLVLDQLPAVRTWGQRYIVYSGESHSIQGGVLRVTSATENTVVRLEDGVTAKLGIGRVVDFVVQPRTPTLVSCSPYCMATLYNTHLSPNTCLGRGQNGCNAGPSLINLPAVNQFLPYYSLLLPTLGQDSRFLKIVITCAATRGLVMNGVLLSDLPWKTSEGNTWCGVTIKVTKHGVNTLYHQDGVTFGVMVVVIGGHHSYTYSGGRRFEVAHGDKVSTSETKPTINAKANMAIRPKNTPEKEAYKYKIAMITTSALCAIVLLAMVIVLLRYRAKRPKNIPAGNDTTMNTKPPIESEYQSIRGFPRRNTHPYEEVPIKPKLPLKTNRPAITDILPQSENGQDYVNDHQNDQDYENSEDYENLKFKNRESSAYVPMDEALAGCAMTSSAIVLSMSGENDLYLTMKKLMTGAETPQEQEEVQE